MDVTEAREHAVHLMEEHGLVVEGWTFEFDRAKHRLGLCNSDLRRISISKYFTGVATKDQFEQAVLHEIAHALLPTEVRHGEQWKQKAEEIGYRGRRLAHNPYYERREKREAKELPDRIAVMKEETVTIQQIPAKGDLLLLPNGVEAKVIQVDRHQTEAVEVGGSRMWRLDSSSAYHLIQR
jgi:hypothetical protein